MSSDSAHIRTSPMPDLRWDPEEQAILDHIAAAMRGIQAWGLLANADELAGHVHGLQLFVAIHAMKRIGFKDISTWYTSQMPEEVNMNDTETPQPPAEPERDNMEDAGPEESGTVGDQLEESPAAEDAADGSDEE